MTLTETLYAKSPVVGFSNGAGARQTVVHPGKTSLRKQLGWHIAQTEPHSLIMTIPPSLATCMLERNVGEDFQNRYLSLKTVEKYVNEFHRGWFLTGSPVIFSCSGRLLDGQHRLEACVASGLPFTTFVTFGIEDAAFSRLDRGKVRTAGDIYSIEGIPDANKMAAATFCVWKYHNTGMSSPDSVTSPTPDELLTYFREEHPNLSGSITYGRRFKGLAQPSVMTALHYLCSKQDPYLADKFFESVATGAGLAKGDPALQLRNRLIAERVGGSGLSAIFEAAFTVIAWNSARTRRTLRALRWRTKDSPNLPFPEIV